jgi:hypothetical protein
MQRCVACAGSVCAVRQGAGGMGTEEACVRGSRAPWRSR